MNLLAAAIALSSLPPSEAVLMLYHQACNLGELRLDPSEATVYDDTNGSTPFTLLTQWGKPETLTYIKIKYPKTTYILIATYKPKYPRQMARVCQVNSNAITHDDAERAFLSAVQNPKITQEWYQGQYYRPFEIDRPKEGFRKRLFFADPNWVILETDLYKEAH